MTMSNASKLSKLTEQARNGIHVIQYLQMPVSEFPGLETWRFDWRSILRTLFAAWSASGLEIRGVSFLFKDAPYQLSRLVFDAVVVWDEEKFRRLETHELPTAIRSALAMFEETVQTALLCKVGDVVAAMAEKYAHQLLCGQGYLSLETLCVLNIKGRNMSGVDSLTPTLPYSIVALLEGSFADIVARRPVSNAPGGAFEMLQWVAENAGYFRASEERVQAIFEDHPCPAVYNPWELAEFEQVVRTMHEKVQAESCEAT